MPPFLVSREGGAGLSYTGTRRQAFRTPTPGVRMPSTESAWIDDVRAVSLVMPAAAAFSHQTAAQLFGLPLPVDDEQPLHVTVPPGVARGRRKIIAWHEGRIQDRIVTVKGLRVTHPDRIWMDLGAHLSLPDLVAVGDVLVRRGLCRELPVVDGARGARLVRHARELVNPASDSRQESILRVNVHLAGLPSPEVNFDVIHLGEWIGRGDLVWPQFRLYVEYDGGHHNAQSQRHQDAQTRNRLSQLGWNVRVVTARMTDKMHEVVAMIDDELRAGGWRG